MNKNYIHIWLLLATAFCIFFGFSLWADDIDLGAFAIKKSGMADFLSEKAATPIDTIPTPQVVEPIAKEEPDTMPKTVLFIGDSMLEGLSPRLAAYCDAAGHKLYTVIWYSSTSEVWGKNTLITRYIKQLKPDYIFICLGANELFVRDIATKRDKYVKHMLAEIGDIPYLWIGPPNWKPDTGINDLVKSNVPKGQFFLSDGMKFDRKKDGAHPTAESSIVWMDSIVRWIPGHAAHPLRLVDPEKKTGRPQKIFVHKPGNTP